MSSSLVRLRIVTIVMPMIYLVAVIMLITPTHQSLSSKHRLDLEADLDLDYKMFIDTDEYNKLLRDLLAEQFGMGSKRKRVAVAPGKKAKPAKKPKSGKPQEKNDASLDTKLISNADKTFISATSQYKAYIQNPGYLVKMNDELFWAYVHLLQAIYVPRKNGDKVTWRSGNKQVEFLREVLKTEAVRLIGRERSNFKQRVFKINEKYKWELLRGAVGHIPTVGFALQISVVVIENFPKVVSGVKNIIRTQIPHWRVKLSGKHGPQGKDGGGKYQHHKDEDDDLPGIGNPYNLYILQEVMHAATGNLRSYEMLPFRTDRVADATGDRYVNERGTFDCDFPKVKKSKKENVNPVQQFKLYMTRPGYLVKMDEEIFWAFFQLMQAIFVPNKYKEKPVWNSGRDEAEFFRNVLKTEAVTILDRARSNFKQKTQKFVKKNAWEWARRAVGPIPILGLPLQVSFMVIENFDKIKKNIDDFLRRKYPRWRFTKEGYVHHTDGDDVGPDAEPYNLYLLQEVYEVASGKKNYDMITFSMDGRKTNPSGMMSCRFKKVDIWNNFELVDE